MANFRRKKPFALFLFLLLVVPFSGCAHFDRSAEHPQPVTATAANSGCYEPNIGVGQYFEVINGAAPQMVEIMKEFPKGGDIHNHLSGTILPEDYIAMGIEEGDCYDAASYALTVPPCRPADPPLSQAGPSDRRNIVKTLSMHDFNYPNIQSGHDHFFDTFGNFGVVSGDNQGAMIAKMLQQADEDNVGYLETMMSFQSGAVSDLAGKLQQKYRPDGPYYTKSGYYPEMYAYLTANGLGDIVAAARADLAGYQAGADAILGCGTGKPEAACGINRRFLSQVNRNSTLPKVFVQTAFSFLLCRQEPLVVGVNLVSGEDLPTSMGDFDSQMQMFAFFHKRSPDVNIALHAGEITPCFVGAGNTALKNHISRSIAAGAKRIGHGISFEFLNAQNKDKITDAMRLNNALVEILFTSNAQILGVTGDEHPFPQYFRERRLPVAFSTDDEGVSYADYTMEWVYAVLEYDLTYDELVMLARYSLQYNFLPGEPLWQDVASARIVDQCASLQPGSSRITDRCRNFLKGSEKANQQWLYEALLARFSQTYGQDLERYLADGHRNIEPAGPPRTKGSAAP